MTDAVLAEAAALSERGDAFVLATVVWRRAPSSGQLGSKALILADGTMRGWLGGACAQPTVRREALTSLDDGRTRLLLLGCPPRPRRRLARVWSSFRWNVAARERSRSRWSPLCRHRWSLRSVGRPQSTR